MAEASAKVVIDGEEIELPADLLEDVSAMVDLVGGGRKGPWRTGGGGH